MDGDHDDAGFDAWLAGDPRRREVFDTMWRRVMGPEAATALIAWERRGASRRGLVTSGIAMLLVGAGVYQAMPWQPQPFAPPVHYVAPGERVRNVDLADGSRLLLAPGTEVRVRYTGDDRRVELMRGTLFADVAHDAGRPFRIDAGKARIVNIGTSFEVSLRPEHIRVTVASGAVRFGGSGWFDRPVTLGAEQGAVLDQAGVHRLADVPSDHVARWRDIWVEYQGAPLRQVVADLQGLSALPIKIVDEQLALQPVSGRIRLTDPAGQLRNLAIVHAFHIHHADGALQLSKHPAIIVSP